MVKRRPCGLFRSPTPVKDNSIEQKVRCLEQGLDLATIAIRQKLRLSNMLRQIVVQIVLLNRRQIVRHMSRSQIAIVEQFALVESAHGAQSVRHVDLYFIYQIAFWECGVVLFPGVMDPAVGEVDNIIRFGLNCVDVLIGIYKVDLLFRKFLASPTVRLPDLTSLLRCCIISSISEALWRNLDTIRPCVCQT